jgi:hypothetical protein
LYENDDNNNKWIAEGREALGEKGSVERAAPWRESSRREELHGENCSAEPPARRAERIAEEQEALGREKLRRERL